MPETPKQIKTASATQYQLLPYPGSSRDVYECANPWITRGLTAQPSNYSACINNSAYGSKISAIVSSIGGLPSPVWSGPSAISGSPTTIDSAYLNKKSPECDPISTTLGNDWKGCFWSAPDSFLSCNCPEIGDKYEQYLKLRLNVATFWNTPIETPVLRKRFLDAISYGPKVTFTVAGDFSIRPGIIVSLTADNISGYDTSTGTSVLSKKYFVLSVKNTCTNSGTQETTLTAVEVLY
jgi:hypothetical protein